MDKKACIALALISCAALAANAQLKGSHWIKAQNGKGPGPFTIEFAEDSAILRSADSTVLEKMAFTAGRGKLSLRKGTGSTLCSTEDIALYDFDIKGSGMEIRLISDPCGQRSVAFVGDWSKNSQ